MTPSAIARVIGALCAMGAAALWLTVYLEVGIGGADPRPAQLGTDVFGLYTPSAVRAGVVVGFMVMVALGALVGAIRGNPWLLLIAFLLSFLPIGLFLLFGPAPYVWIGLLDLGFLVSAVMLMRSETARADAAGPAAPDRAP